MREAFYSGSSSLLKKALNASQSCYAFRSRVGILFTRPVQYTEPVAFFKRKPKM